MISIRLVNVYALVLLFAHKMLADESIQLKPATNVTHYSQNATERGPGIESFCATFGIHPSNCSCSKIPDLCHVQKELQILHNEMHKDTGNIFRRIDEYSLTYASITVLASLIGLTGNTAVLIISFRQRKGLSSCKLHIAELGCVNFLFSALQLFNVVPLYVTNKWVYGVPMCKVVRTLMESLTLLTICFILIVAIERFVLIVYPFDGKILQGRVKHFVFLLMVVMVTATSLPYLWGTGIDWTGRCVAFQGTGGSNMAVPYTWCVVCVYGVCPLCVMCVAYGRVIASLSNIGSRNPACTNVSMVISRMKRNKRIIRNAFAILLMFMVCEIPHRFLYIYIAHNPQRPLQQDPNNYLIISFISYFLSPLQNTLNPLLYSMVDTTWKKNVYRYCICARATICCGFAENHSQSSTLKDNNSTNPNEKIIVHTMEHNFELELALIQSDNAIN